MVIIDYFLPYNNFIVLICLIMLNIILIFKRSYWQTFLIANLLLLAILVLIGFNPVKTFEDVVNEMFNFFESTLKRIIKSILDLIF